MVLGGLGGRGLTFDRSGQMRHLGRQVPCVMSDRSGQHDT